MAKRAKAAPKKRTQPSRCEHMVRAAGLRAFFGVSEAVPFQWRSRGCPSRGEWFDLAEVGRWLYSKSDKQGRAAEAALLKKEADARSANAKAIITEIEAKARAGDVVSRQEHETALRDWAEYWSDALERSVGEITMAVVGKTEAEVRAAVQGWSDRTRANFLSVTEPA